MNNRRLRRQSELEPIEVARNNIYFSPKVVNSTKNVMLDNKISLFKVPKESFSGSLRKNTQDNINMINGLETPNYIVRDISVVKKRDRYKLVSVVASPGSTYNRSQRSRLRHPKIALPRKNFEKIRVFRLNSNADEDTESIFSRELNDTQDDTSTYPPYFRAKSNIGIARIDTPGFLSSEIDKNTRTIDHDDTTETNTNSTNTVTTNPRRRKSIYKLASVKRDKRFIKACEKLSNGRKPTRHGISVDNDISIFNTDSNYQTGVHNRSFML
jgi:hypothetical protein